MIELPVQFHRGRCPDLLARVHGLLGLDDRRCAPPKSPESDNERLIWIIIIVFVPYMGAVVYYLFRRPERIRALAVKVEVFEVCR